MRIDPDDIKDLVEEIEKIHYLGWTRWDEDGNEDNLDTPIPTKTIDLIENFLTQRNIIVDYNYN